MRILLVRPRRLNFMTVFGAIACEPLELEYLLPVCYPFGAVEIYDLTGLSRRPISGKQPQGGGKDGAHWHREDAVPSETNRVVPAIKPPSLSTRKAPQCFRLLGKHCGAFLLCLLQGEDPLKDDGHLRAGQGAFGIELSGVVPLDDAQLDQ